MAKKFSTSNDLLDFGSLKDSTKKFAKCAHSHPPVDMGGFQVYGGSGNDPHISDADIYVGFDSGMKRTVQGYPWESGIEFLFYIPDGGVPSSVEDTKKLIAYLIAQGKAGHKIHIGCIGGHGRTGLILAAMYTVLTGEKDSITHIRKVYCKKAVESKAQVEWLHKHFGITKVAGSRGEFPTKSSYGKGQGQIWQGALADDFEPTFSTKSIPLQGVPISPVNYSRNIWGTP